MKTSSILLIILCLGALGSILPVAGLPIPGFYDSPIGIVNISSPIPDSPSDITAYQVQPDPNDTAYFSVPDLEKIRNNLSTEADAPQVAQKILDNYGGLPADAVLTESTNEYLISMNGTTNQEVARYPVSTNVQYGRKIGGVPVVGDGAYIIMELGDNGELLYLNKVWRTVTPSGTLPVQTIENAINKLRNGEVLNPKKDAYNVNITKIKLGYFERGANQAEEYLEPAWLFKGTTNTGESIQYYVYARKFANFDADPTDISMYGPISFYDTSDANPTRWYWDFGDETNSTEQNPTHYYKSAGDYTINLTVWNDLGSDTISKENFVHIRYFGNAPVAMFESNYTWENQSSPMPLAFIDKSSGNITQWKWDFGDGTNSTEENPVHIFNFSGEPEDFRTWYFVSLNATDAFGRSSYYFGYYMVSNGTQAEFIGEPISGKAPLNVTFIDLNPDPNGWVSGWLMDFGDGSSESWDYSQRGTFPGTISHTYQFPGNYTVSLTHEITDNIAYIERTKANYISVTGSTPPVADFVPNISSGPVPLTILFNDTSANSPDTWAWDFGDGSVSSTRNPIHQYAVAGTYSVSLIVTNTDGSDTLTKKDSVRAIPLNPPVADFISNVTSGNASLAVGFTDVSTNSPREWSWDFGDGKTSTLQNPEHIFEAPGNYSVTLNATNEAGSDMVSKPEYVHVSVIVPDVPGNPSVPPVSDFSANVTSGKKPLSVQFTDLSLNYPSGWSWSFGDGGKSSDQKPVHTYVSAGIYTVILTTGNGYGENTSMKIDYIEVQPVSPPVADFNATPFSGKPPLLVQFADNSSGSPVSWLWNFGDGTNSSARNPSHTYLNPGTYTVSIEVSNDDGTDTKTRPGYISVIPLNPPVANFSVNSTTGPAPFAVAFTDTSTGVPTSWLWNFGDGVTATERNSVHIYPNPGKYSVSLTVWNADGNNTKNAPDFINVTPGIVPPAADFIAKPTCGKAPLTVTFTDLSDGIPTSWLWKFGDGSTSFQKNPVHIYYGSGKFSVTLTVSNAGGNSTKTRTSYISVSPMTPPEADFIGKPTCGPAPLSVNFTDTSSGNPDSWSWSFGDGAGSTTKNPIHIFTKPGKYSISLKVGNPGGNDSKTRNDYITVTQMKPPRADFVGNTTQGRSPLSVTFNDTSSGSPDSWFWDFGDRTNSTRQNPVHSYQDSGSYTITLTAGNSAGYDTTVRNHYILVLPVSPTPTVSPTHTCSQNQEYQKQLVSGSVENGQIRLDWNRINDTRLQEYRVWISKNDPVFAKEEVGSITSISDRNVNFSIIDSSKYYDGGDFGGHLEPGQKYYFMVEAVYSDQLIRSNVIEMTCPSPKKTDYELADASVDVIPSIQETLKQEPEGNSSDPVFQNSTIR